jgi:dual specificity tyrosine-phosphorylation-regulated kinase 2/3/4
MPGLPAATLSRVNSIRESPSSQSSAAKASAVSSRLSAATISSLAKQAEAPRTRHNLPTIAGSPSVNAAGLTLEPIDIQSMVQQHQLPKETPTKIPRRTGSGQTASPQPSLRSQAQLQASTSRRASLNVTGGLVSDTFADDVFDEFGMISTAPRQSPKPNTTSKSLAVSVSHKQPLALSSKTKRDSISFGGLHKMTASNESSQSRFSALSPSKSLKFLTPKSSIPSSRLSSTATRALSPSSSRQSLSTPSPVPSALDEDEVLGDEEMLEWMKRQQSKRSTNPAKREELDDLLRVPEIFAPSLPSSTSGSCLPW